MGQKKNIRQRFLFRKKNDRVPDQENATYLKSDQSTNASDGRCSSRVRPQARFSAVAEDEGHVQAYEKELFFC